MRYFLPMDDNSLVSPVKEVRGSEKSSKKGLSRDEMRKSTAKPTLLKGGKKTTTAPTSKDVKSSGVALNVTDLGCFIGDALKG